MRRLAPDAFLSSNLFSAGRRRSSIRYAAENALQLQIGVEITRTDFDAFSRQVLHRMMSGSGGRFDNRFWKFGAWLALVALLVIVFRTTGFRPGLPLVGFLVLVAISAGIYSYYFQHYRSRLSPLDDGSILGTRVLTISDSGIREVSTSVETTVRWNGLRELIETPEHFFIMTDSIAGFIIPKRCLPSDAVSSEIRALETRFSRRLTSK